MACAGVKAEDPRAADAIAGASGAAAFVAVYGSLPVATDNRVPAARPQFRLRITKGEDIAVGPGKVELLGAFASRGSISAAARALGMSYRRAWLLVDTMNRCFRAPVVEAEAGGRRGGGTRLTTVGDEVVRRYRASEQLAAQAAAGELAALAGLLR